MRGSDRCQACDTGICVRTEMKKEKSQRLCFRGLRNASHLSPALRPAVAGLSRAPGSVLPRTQAGCPDQRPCGWVPLVRGSAPCSPRCSHTHPSLLQMFSLRAQPLAAVRALPRRLTGPSGLCRYCLVLGLLPAAVQGRCWSLPGLSRLYEHIVFPVIPRSCCI